jgi:hypothetical protein
MGLISPPTWKIVTLIHEDMEDQVPYLAMDLVDVVMCGNQVLSKHLFVDFLHAQGNQMKLVAKVK